MRPYFDRYPGEENKAILHYEQNIRLSESFGPSLSVFEVTLRNSLIRELERMSGQKEWYLFFKSHPVLVGLYNYISTACSHISRRGEEPTVDKINGELTLGFWVSLFNAEYEQYLWKDLRRAFPNLPKNQKQRKRVSSPLNTIRFFRNRVYHNESISWSLAKLSSLHSTIIEVIEWMNSDLPTWLRRIDRYDYVKTKTLLKWYGLWWYLLRKLRQLIKRPPRTCSQTAFP